MAAAKTLNSDANHKKGHRIIRTVYLYLVAMIGLITFIFGGIGMINTVLQNYVFQVNDLIYTPIPYPGMKLSGGCNGSYLADPSNPNSKMVTPTPAEVETCQKVEKEQQDQNRRNSIDRELSISIAQLLIGLPVWLFHWGIIQKEYRKKEEHS